MIECPMCSGEIKNRRCVECGWTMAGAFSQPEPEPIRPERQEFHLDTPEFPSTIEDARAALADVTATLARKTALPATSREKRYAELKRQANLLTTPEGERVE